jgi:nicotinate-nucleotide pyrophosphorylase (carboxylating)
MEIYSNLDTLIDMALEEDLQDLGDITSEAIFSDRTHTFFLFSKGDGILCGLEVFERVISRIDSRIKVTAGFSDGDRIKKGDKIAGISGQVTSILKAERTALNFLSLLSAVATRTSDFVKEAGGRLVILDTRKTIPGFRPCKNMR